jgi:aminoglycoside/choline kinase family phosphotransferase
VLEPSFAYLSELIRGIDPDAAGGELEPRPMKGGASTRRFFRVAWGKEKSAVAMFVPGQATHEIHKDRPQVRWPFLEVRDLLADRGIRVPRILADGTDQGWLVVEDLGDDTVANYLLKSPSEKRAIYQMAVKDLARAQKQLEVLPESSIVRGRAFDHDLLRWEIEHFMEWGVLARGIAVSAQGRTAFDRIAGQLAARIAGWPRGFVHRDYQSRNLMVVAAEVEPVELAWIDFQDALLGPRVYDLVALLSDSYQEFDRRFIEERLDEYAEQTGLSASERGTLGREFDFVTVQRKLKDAGRFVFIDRAHHNPSFLSFVEPTIKKARAALARLADDADMRELGSLLDRLLGT